MNAANICPLWQLGGPAFVSTTREILTFLCLSTLFNPIKGQSNTARDHSPPCSCLHSCFSVGFFCPGNSKFFLLLSAAAHTSVWGGVYQIRHAVLYLCGSGQRAGTEKLLHTDFSHLTQLHTVKVFLKNCHYNTECFLISLFGVIPRNLTWGNMLYIKVSFKDDLGQLEYLSLLSGANTEANC